jgi:hypothetical protein
MSPHDVFEKVVDTFPDYGSNVNPEKMQKWLRDNADWYGTPTPEELFDWASRFRGVSDDTAADLEAQYDDALYRMVQRGKLDPEEVQSLFYPTNQQETQPEPQGRERRSGSRTEATVSTGVQGGEQQPQNRGRRKAYRAKESALEQSAQASQNAQAEQQAPAPEPQSRAAQVSPAPPQPPSDNGDKPRDERIEELERTVEALEATEQRLRKQTQEEPDGGMTLADNLDQLVEVEKKIEELRGGSGQDTDPRLQEFSQRLGQLEQSIAEAASSNSSSESDNIVSVVASAEGIDPDKKAELIQSLGGGGMDPEVKKAEYELEQKQVMWENVSNAIKEAASGMGGGGGESGGTSMAKHLGEFLSGLRGSGARQQPVQQPAQQPRQPQQPVQQQPQAQPQRAQPQQNPDPEPQPVETVEEPPTARDRKSESDESEPEAEQTEPEEEQEA